MGLVLLDLEGCGRSRAEVAYGISRELGINVTVAQIDAIVAATKVNRLPAEWVAAWVKVTGSRRLLEHIAGQLGLSLATQEDRDHAKRSRAMQDVDQLTQKLSRGVL